MFSTVKLRTRVTKGSGSKQAALAMAYKLLDSTRHGWHRINGYELIAQVLDSVEFKHGIRATDNDTSTTDPVERVPRLS